MTNFCTRLVIRTLGLEPTVQPLIASMFIPGDAIALDSATELSAVDRSQANLVSPYAETLSTVTPLADAPKSLLSPSHADALLLATPSPLLDSASQVEQRTTLPSVIPSQVNLPPEISSPSSQTKSASEKFIQKSEATGDENVNITSDIQPIPVTPTPISSQTLERKSARERFIQKSEAIGDENVNITSDVQPISVTPAPISSQILQTKSASEKFIQKSEATGDENVNITSDVQPISVTPAPISSQILQTKLARERFIQKSEAIGDENVNITSDIQPVSVIHTPNVKQNLEIKSANEKFIEKLKTTGDENVNIISDAQPIAVTPATIFSQTLQTKSPNERFLEKLKTTGDENVNIISDIQPIPVTPAPISSQTLQTKSASEKSIQKFEDTRGKNVNIISDVQPVSTTPVPISTHSLQTNNTTKQELPGFMGSHSELLTGNEERKEGVKNSPLHQPQLTPVIFPQAQIPVSQPLEVDKTTNSRSGSASDSKHPVTTRLSQHFLVGRSHSDSFHKSQTAISPISEKAGGRGAGSRGENTIVGTALISAPAAKVPELMPGYKEQPLLAQRPQTIASSPTPTPTINITIGRVEVRGVNPPTPTPSTKAVRRSPALSLDNYLQQRNGGQR